MRLVTISVVAAVALLARSTAHAQGRTVTLSEAVCTACRINLVPKVTLGDDDGPGGIGPIADIIALRDGRYVLTYDDASSELVVFSPDGQFVRRIGRRGRGPGEFEFIRWVREVDGQLHVFDPTLRRQTVLSGDFRPLRTAPFMGEPLGDVLVVNDSLTIMNALIRSRAHAGYLLHAFDRRGTILRSTASPAGGYRFGVSDVVYFRRLARGSSGGFWSAHRTRYRIEQWSIDGALERTFLRDARWFPDHLGNVNAPDPDRPPMPHIVDVREDDQGRLWSLVRVAASDWSRALRPTPPGAHPELGRYAIDDLNRAFDTIIEVFDVRREILIVSQRADQAFFRFVGEDQIASYSETPAAIPKVHLWRLSLR